MAGTARGSKCCRSNANKIFLPQRVLSIPRVELDDTLDSVEGLDIQGQWFLGDQEGESFRAGRCREGPLVLEQGRSLEMFD